MHTRFLLLVAGRVLEVLDPGFVRELHQEQVELVRRPDDVHLLHDALEARAVAQRHLARLREPPLFEADARLLFNTSGALFFVSLFFSRLRVKHRLS